MRLRFAIVGMVVGAMALLPVAAHASTTAKKKACTVLKTTEVGQALGGEASAPEPAGDSCGWIVTITLPNGSTQVTVTNNVIKYSGSTKKDVERQAGYPGVEEISGIKGAKYAFMSLPGESGTDSFALIVKGKTVIRVRLQTDAGVLDDAAARDALTALAKSAAKKV